MQIKRSATSKATELDRYREEALARLSENLRNARLSFVTDLPGQDGVYLAKEAEARRFLAEDPTPADLTAYPWLAAEVGITAPSPLALAQLWIAKSDEARAAAPAMETIKATARKSLADAQTKEDIEQACAVATAALNAFCNQE